MPLFYLLSKLSYCAKIFLISICLPSSLAFSFPDCKNIASTPPQLKHFGSLTKLSVPTKIDSLKLELDKNASSAISPYNNTKSVTLFLDEISFSLKALFNSRLKFRINEDDKLILQKETFEFSYNPLNIGLKHVDKILVGKLNLSNELIFELELRGHINTNSTRYVKLFIPDLLASKANKYIEVKVHVLEIGNFIYNNNTSHTYRTQASGSFVMPLN